MGHLTFNKVHLGNDFFDHVSPRVTGLLLHEFAHNVVGIDSTHDPRWYAEADRLAGLAVHYAAVNTEFQKYLEEEA